MPEVSYDTRSFQIDGRRVWLVSGSVPYARTPRGLWRDRIRAAKQAGLNCIDTPVFWSAHEREPGTFDFEGDLDLRHFVELIAEEGLYCTLRPGPYVGSGWDLGGLPAYLHGVADKKGNKARFRENEPQFMEAIDRYLRALMEQVGDLQAPSLDGGPIVLMQAEQAWLSHNPEGGSAYLERLVSMLRQRGCLVPIVNTNNLWQPVEGTIDTWNGSLELPAMTRQLATVQPQAPPLVMELTVDGTDAWGSTPHDNPSSDQLADQLAGLIGVGAQFNLAPLHPGSALGFSSDTRYPMNRGPLSEAGERGKSYTAIKRICTFASHFGHVLAARDTAPAPTAALDGDHPTALLHQRGAQGEMVMLIKSPRDKSKHTQLMLPTGLKLDVPHHGQRAAWVLLDTNLAGNATLDYTSLSPWALAGKSLLVVFGPAGSQGVISIDGQHHAVTVPTGKTPSVIQGDPVHIAVLNHEQIDAAYLAPDAVVIGCDGLDNDNSPRPLKGWGTQFTITHAGEVTRKRINQPSAPTAPRPGKWQTLSLKPLVDGTDESYQPIDAPADMGALGQAFGYGWYRFKTPKPVNDNIHLVDGGDRLHLYSDAKLSALLGDTDGATPTPTKLKLKLAGETVVFADNLGRNCYGQRVGRDLKGLAGHLYTVKPIKPGEPERLKQPAGDPFEAAVLAQHQRAGVRPMSQAIAWTIKPQPRRPIIMELHTAGLGVPSVVRINDEPIHFDAADERDGVTRLLLDPADDGPMTGGKNHIKLELLHPLPDDADPSTLVRFYQTTGQATPKDGIAFTPWTIPAGDDPDWRDVPKSLPSQPAWLKCSFNLESLDAPLWLELGTLSKGQVVLNGHNLGRYWVQTREGKLVHPDQRLYLPEAWLSVDEPNELMIFDEHGRTPEKCRLTYDTKG